MKDNNQELWLGVEQLNNDPALTKVANQEFVELPILEQVQKEEVLETTSNRRDFLKYLGFGLGAATVAAGCEIPVRHAMPYVTKPDSIVPGVATYYASSFVQAGDYCPVLVKTREGRPIKIEGNTLSSVTKGGTSARAQASVLSLYDVDRNQAPRTIAEGKFGEKSTWAEIDAAIKSALAKASNVRIVSNTIISPTTKKAIADFAASSGRNVQHVMYDPISSSAILDANEAAFGQRVIPDYHFDKASVIVSFGADFLNTWISPIEYAADYAEKRKIKNIKKAKDEMSRHIQVESFMSMTGSNADDRIIIKPSEQGAAIAALASALGVGGAVAGLNDKAAAAIKAVANELKAARGKSLVISGSNNVAEQQLVNAINNALGNYGNTLDFGHVSYLRQGSDKAITNLVSEMNSGRVGAVIFLDDCNPAYDLPASLGFAEALAKVQTKISCAINFNDTAALCDYSTPRSHYLESWGDAEPKRGIYSLIQPTIAPLFDTRQAEVSLLKWAGTPGTDEEMFLYNYIKQNWMNGVFASQSSFNRPQSFWDNALHDGVIETGVAKNAGAYAGSASTSGINKPSNAALEVQLYEDVIGNGVYANNPWLQEMPDPVTRCAWGNYLQVPIKWDGNRSWEGYQGLNDNEIYGEADIVKLTANGASANFTVARNFGLKEDTMAVSLGYGRDVVGKAGQGIGTNVFPWVGVDANGNFKYYTEAEYNGKVGEDGAVACVQYHHTIGLEDTETGEYLDETASTTVRKGFQGALTKRVVIRRSNAKDLETFVYGKHHGDDHGGGHHGSMNPFNPDYMGLVGEREHHQKLNAYTLYPGHEDILNQGHLWGMHVDLNACTGCAACTVACMAENNVPVVGKKEIGRHHEMAWLRIDRYFYGDYENPNVVYQPMMCQHCDNAPCENVCPVAATPHSSEGLNQMTYNRCIGTRYCANNCPYKVRRFNWLDYTTADLFAANEPGLNGTSEVPYGADNLTRMVLNPDVTVRSRGVIEKCSFCVQRIQEGKLTAKREGRRLKDADVRTACQTACPTGAITFGDRNDPNSELSKKFNLDLNYIALEQTNVRSSVQYTAKVVNKPQLASLYEGGHSHGRDDHGHDDHSH